MSAAEVVKLTKHKCGRVHTTPGELVRCAIGKRRVLWGRGRGRIAVVSMCGDWNDVTFSLHGSIASARRDLKLIDKLGCSGSCSKDHYLLVVIP